MTFLFAPSTPSPPAVVVTKSTWVVEDVATIIAPVDFARIRSTIFHNGPGNLLIEFGSDNPTLSNYAFSLPEGNLYAETTWKGAIRAISQDGNPITVLVRNFYGQ